MGIKKRKFEGKIETVTTRQANSNRQLNDIINQIKSGAQETTTATQKTRSIIKSLEHLVNQLQAHTRHAS